MIDADMAQSKDPAIKLFGRKIPLSDPSAASKHAVQYDGTGTRATASGAGVESIDPSKVSARGGGGGGGVVRQVSPPGNDVRKAKEETTENDGNDQEKQQFKKPDKILECPRCNSMDTKFCYFNNYNVNQPRHFCKNCQRYWTAGGTMRNVPIGAGRRKNKHLASQYHQILVSSDGMHIPSAENSDAISHLLSPRDSAAVLSPSSMGTERVIKFGPESPLCNSVETVLSIGEKKRCIEVSSVVCQESGEKSSGRSSSKSPMEALLKTERVGVGLPTAPKDCHRTHPICPVLPWVFPWNPVWNNNGGATTSSSQHASGSGSSMNSNDGNQLQWCPTPMLAVPGFCPPTMPLQLVPASYWGCMPLLSPGSNGFASPSSSTSTGCCSVLSSPTLGKHSREMDFFEDEKADKCVLVPTTVRINDANDAVKTHSWATLGPKLEKGPISRSTVFKPFETQSESKGRHESLVTHILEANPSNHSVSCISGEQLKGPS